MPNIGGILRAVGAIPEEVGGTEDHVHVLTGTKATHRLADVLREVKSGSSQWVHQQLGFRSFAWQEGYAAITVSPSALDAVRRYIALQEEHHRKKTFQEEYLELLNQSGIAFDSRYLW